MDGVEEKLFLTPCRSVFVGGRGLGDSQFTSLAFYNRSGIPIPIVHLY